MAIRAWKMRGVKLSRGERGVLEAYRWWTVSAGSGHDGRELWLKLGPLTVWHYRTHNGRYTGATLFCRWGIEMSRRNGSWW